MTATDQLSIEPRSIDPDTARSRIVWAARDCWTIVVQEFTHLARQPSTFAWQLGMPVMMVLMFVYVFGSAMDVTGQGAGEGYIDYAMPGMFAMTMAFGFMNTAFAVTLNKEKGFMDRFRSMPMSSSAVVTGRGVSDIIQAAVDLFTIAVLALMIGWRSHGTLTETVAAFGLLVRSRRGQARGSHRDGRRVRAATVAAPGADLHRHLRRPADQEHRGRRLAVRRGVPGRVHLLGVRPA